jgi:CRP-like cAMP-binding protein
MSPKSDSPALLPMVRKLQRWQPLDEEDQAALLALPHVLRTLSAAQYVVWDGDRPQNSCLLLSGFAIRHKIAAGGARQILSVHMRGDVIDLQNSLLGVADHNVQMLTAGEVAMIPSEAIVEIASARPAVGFALWLETLVDGAIFREWIVNVGRRDARTRVAHLLCEFALRLEVAGLGKRTDYEMPMTQEQLSDAVGLTSVHVNRTLMGLGADHLISRTHRNISVVDWDALAKVGDFDPRYLHLSGNMRGGGLISRSPDFRASAPA